MNMPKVTIDFDEVLLKDVQLKDEKMIRHIFALGLTQLKIDQALQLYKQGGMSIGYAAELAGIPKQEMFRQARVRGIEPSFTEETLREDLGLDQ
jgi:predicted HTH domain antitoxin